MIVPAADETVAAGAAAQAAAIHEGSTPDDVARRWGLGAGVTVEPKHAVGDLRDRYAAASNTS